MSEPTLDEQVAEALGHEVTIILGDCWINTNADHPKKRKFTPSTNGQQAMDLLREHRVSLISPKSGENKWKIVIYINKEEGRYGVTHEYNGYGPTLEIAICKAIVASKATDKTLEQIRQNDL